MALVRKTPVEQEEPVEKAVEQKEVIDGSKLLSQKFREDFETQWSLIETAYNKKIVNFSEKSAVRKKLQSLFAKTKIRRDRFESFFNEIISGNHTDKAVSFKLTKGASAFLRFTEASTKAPDFILVQTSDEVDSVATMFSKIGKADFASDELVINIPKGVFAALRFKFSNTFKNFVSKWIKNLDAYQEEQPAEEQETEQSKPTPAKTETKKRSSTAEPRPKTKKEQPPQVTFIGIIVGHEITEDKRYIFSVLNIEDKSVIEMSGKMSDGLYLKTFHKCADKCAEGIVIPVVCHNWHEKISKSYCMSLYYDEDDYAEFDEKYKVKISDLKSIFEEYRNR